MFKKSILLQLLYNNNKLYNNNIKNLYTNLYNNIYQLINSNKAIKNIDNNNYINLVYSKNNNNLFNNLNTNYLIRSIIIRILYNKLILNKNLRLSTYYIKLLISDIFIKSTNNTINVLLFIYIPKNKWKNNMIISRILNNINISNISIFNGKKLIIQPIYIKYDYFNSDILSQSINKNINFNKSNGIRSSYIKNLNLVLPINNKSNNIIINNNIIYNNILILSSYNKLFNNLNINNKNLSNNIYMNSYYNLFINKFITGVQWEFIGKKLVESKRSVKNNFTIGTFKYITKNNITNKGKNTLILNNYKSNLQLSKNNNSYIGPVGKYNINVSISHI